MNKMKIKRYGGLKTFYMILLSLIFCAALLSGCGPAAGEGEQESSRTTEQSDAGKEKAAPDKKQIQFWFSGGSTAVSVMRGILSDFNHSQEEYMVELTAFDTFSELYSRVQEAITTETAPDLVVLERDASKELYSKGLTVDLTRILKKDAAMDPEHFLSVYYDQGVTEDGRIFAMPLYGTTQVVFYNKSAFKEADIEPGSIRTWQDLAGAAKKIQKVSRVKYGWETIWGYESMVDAALSNGGSIFSEDGGTVTINTPEWVEVWDTFRRWIHEDRIMGLHSGGYGLEYRNYTKDDVLRGYAGGYIGSAGDHADLNPSWVGVMEQPAWDDDDRSLPAAKALLLNVMSTSSEEQKQGAYALLRYLIDVPAQVDWCTGTGYIAVNKDVREDPEYLAYLDQDDYSRIPLTQSGHASVYPVDPTGGMIREVLTQAADRVQIENIPAKEALDDAQRMAQEALDEVYMPEEVKE